MILVSVVWNHIIMRMSVLVFSRTPYNQPQCKLKKWLIIAIISPKPSHLSKLFNSTPKQRI